MKFVDDDDDDVLSLNRHWSIIWSMTVCWMLDQSSFRRRRNSSRSCTEF